MEENKKTKNETIENVVEKEPKVGATRLWIRSIAFILIAILLLGMVQSVLTKNWYYPTFENVYQTVNGIDEIHDGALEVLFMGTSHIEYAISPIQIYEDTGIVSYNLSTSKQLMPNTYYLLKRVLKKQKPKVVVVDVSAAFLPNKDNASWRYLLDSMKLDADKFDMLFNGYRNAKGSDGFFAGLFPIIKFHSRWEELTQTDFEPAPKGFYYSAGQYMRALTQPTDFTLEKANIAAKIADEKFYTKEVKEENIEWIQKINALCKANGAQLLLVKVPVVGDPTEYHSAWTFERCQSMRELAQKENIPYFDFQHDTDIAIDYQKETVDEGHHLNMFGAVKATDVMIQYLQENYDLSFIEYPLYASEVPNYHKVFDLGVMQTTVDTTEYFNLLSANQKDYAIAVTAEKGVMNGSSDQTKEYLKQLGLNKIDKSKENEFYGAIVSEGKVEWEETSAKDELEHKLKWNGNVLKVFCEKKDNDILLNKNDEKIKGEGINLVVVDLETGVAIESIVIKENEDGNTIISRDVFDADDRFQLYENELTSN